MTYESRILTRQRQRKAQPTPERAIYSGYDADAGGHIVRSADGSVRLAESLTLGAISLNQSVQFVGGSFE